MNLYDAALATYDAAFARPERSPARHAFLREEISTARLDDLLRCIKLIEDDDSDDAEMLAGELGTELELMRSRVRQLLLH